MLTKLTKQFQCKTPEQLQHVVNLKVIHYREEVKDDPYNVWANQELTYYLGLKARVDAILANHCLNAVINSIKPIL